MIQRDLKVFQKNGNVHRKLFYRLCNVKRFEQDIKLCCNLTHTSYKMHEN